jgi:hypothetical protein
MNLGRMSMWRPSPSILLNIWAVPWGGGRELTYRARPAPLTYVSIGSSVKWPSSDPPIEMFSRMEVLVLFFPLTRDSSITRGSASLAKSTRTATALNSLRAGQCPVRVRGTQGRSVTAKLQEAAIGPVRITANRQIQKSRMPQFW